MRLALILRSDNGRGMNSPFEVVSILMGKRVPSGSLANVLFFLDMGALHGRRVYILQAFKRALRGTP